MTAAELTALHFEHKEGGHTAPREHCAACYLREDAALTFTVETRRKRGWKTHYEPLEDFYAARKAAASLSTLPGVEGRVTDSDGRVWA